MIVQCSECNARFKLDDSKVTENGVRVRCSKCKAVFVVKKEAPQEEDLDSLLNGLGGEEEAAAPSVSAPAIAASVPPVPEPPASDEFSFDMDQPAAPDAEAAPTADVPASQGADTGFQDFDFNEESFSAAAPQWEEPQAQQPPESSEFSFEEPDAPGGPSDDFTGGAGEETAFDFSETFAPASAAEPEPAPQAPAASSEFSFEEESFSFDEAPAAVPADSKPVTTEPDFLGEFSFGEPEEEKKPAPAASDFSFDFPSAPASDEKPDEFSFGEEEPSKPSAAPEFDDFDLGGAAASPATPASAAAEETDFGEIPPSLPPVSDFSADEVPPSVVGRRQESSAMRRILVAVLVVLAVAGGGFYLTKLSPADLDKIGLGGVAKRFGMAEEIRLEIRNVRGSYVRNGQAGELFVVRGEVANTGNRSRTGIQVKASVFGKGGADIGHRTAFCGNPLTDQQIASQPFAQLEKAMNDQFGKSLSNLGVEPGSSIPFVVVLNNIPQDAVQYGAELAASAPAGK